MTDVIEVHLANRTVALTPSERDDWARRAVKTFQGMEYLMTSFARVLTGDPRARVVMAPGQTCTDGQTIYYRPPLMLGDPSPHIRNQCDRRDADGHLTCPACSVRETVERSVTHEIAHIAGGSFQKSSAREQERILRQAVQFARNPIAKAQLEAGLKRVKWGDEVQLIMAKMSPFLQLLIMALEDARIDMRMFEARPGTRKMFASVAKRISTQGFVTLEGETIRWAEKPLNAQMLIGLLWKIEGFSLGDLHDKVKQDLEDPILQDLYVRVGRAGGALDIAALTIETLVRLWELGYFEPPEDMPEPPPYEPPSPPQDESDSEEGSDGQSESAEQSPREDSDEPEESPDEDPGSPGSDEGDPGGGTPGEGDGGTPTSDSSGRPPVDGGEAEEPEDTDVSIPEGDGTDSEPTGTEGSDTGEPGDGSPEGSINPDDDPAGDAGDPADPASGAEEPGDDNASEPDASSSIETAEEEGDSDGDRPDGPDGERPSSDSDSGDDGSDENGGPDAGDTPPESGGSGEEDELAPEEIPDQGGSDPTPGDDREPVEGDDQPGGRDDDVSADEGDRESEGSEQPEPEGPPSGEPGGGADQAESGTLGDDAGADGVPDQSLEPGDSGPATGNDGNGENSSGLPATDEANGAPEQDPTLDGDGEDGVAQSEPEDLPEDGSAEDVADLIEDLTGHSHDEDEGGTQVAQVAPGEGAAMDKAITQNQHFDSPSATVSSLTVHVWPKDDGLCEGWASHRESTDLTLRIGDVDKRGNDKWDVLRTSEDVLQPALFEARRVFSDNRRAKAERNLKRGKIDGRALGRRAWKGDDDRLYKKMDRPKNRSYAVIIAGDCSWSQHGATMVVTKQAMYAQAEMLHRLGIAFEVWGHTADWTEDYIKNHQNRSQEDWAMVMHQIKDWETPWNQKTQEGLAWLHAVSTNLDGHNLEFLRKRLVMSNATDKILLYYTDGQMPSANKEDELDVLKREVATYQRLGITMLGVGIGTQSPKKWGMDTVRVDNKGDIGKVIKHLEGALLHNRR